MKKVIQLPFYYELQDRLTRQPNLIQVLLGPRQVGKTTSVQEFLKKNFNGKALFESADAIFNANFSWLQERWQEARKNYDLIVIDEIQKIENWSEFIKSLWDEDRKNRRSLRCLLLGSSSLDLQKGLSESLTGRFELIQAYHWNFKESKALNPQLTFDDFLKYGGYPASYALRKDTTRFVNYLQSSVLSTVVEKDILKNHTVKSPALFRQAFELILNYPAQEVSYTKLLGQLQDKGNTELIKHYIHLYEGAFLVKSLFKFSEKPIQKRTSSPKLIPLCPSFYYLKVQDRYDSEERGRAFELAVGALLHRLPGELFYWREGNKEVDFVLKKGKNLIAIEVKSGRKKGAKGLEVFCEQYPKAKPFIITPDNYQQLEDSGLAFFGIGNPAG